MKPLTSGELQAKQTALDELRVVEYTTRQQPVVIAMVGLVGTGKTTVAKKISKKIGGVVVSGNRIRKHLRDNGAPYDRTSQIGEQVARELLEQRVPIVLDSDHAPEKKRASLFASMKGVCENIKFVQTLCDEDIVIGRTIQQSAGESDDLYENARTKWDGPMQPQVVKLREWRRRTPHHDAWRDGADGGKWNPKDMSFVDVTIHTDVEDWEEQIPEF